MSTGLPFAKMNGLGNEIVMVDLRGGKRVLDAAEARAIAARPASRFDQMMVLHDAVTPGSEAYVRIYNADGSEASESDCRWTVSAKVVTVGEGNSVPIFARCSTQGRQVRVYWCRNGCSPTFRLIDARERCAACTTRRRRTMRRS